MSKDDGWLLLAGVVCAALSWAFWHYLGEDAFKVFSACVLVGVVVDNARMRRQLRALRADRKAP